MRNRTAPHIDPVQIPEVVEFIHTRDTLEEFKQEHAEIFEQLQALTERYNTALEQAEKVCREKEVTCGPFDLYQFSTKYNAEALFNAIGRDKFLEMGGKIESAPQYTVDRGRLEACIAQNKLTPEIVKTVRTETPNFHKPKPAVLP